MLFVVKFVILEHTRKSVAMHKTFPANPKNHLIVIFVLGFCAIPAQVVLMREFILIFGGNELIIGLFLAIWMLLTAGGSLCCKNPAFTGKTYTVLFSFPVVVSACAALPG